MADRFTSPSLYLHPNEAAYRRFLHARLATVGLSFDDVKPYWSDALSVTAARFSSIRNKYYQSDERGIPLRAGHFGHTILLLYELSRQAWLRSDLDVANLLYFLNSSAGCNILYEIDIPLRTFCDHPHGAVVGRAEFSTEIAFSFSTNCNIGNSHNVYPKMNGNLVMLPNSAILGNTTIAGNVVMSHGSKLLDAGEIRDVIVFGSAPENIFKPLSPTRYQEICNFRS
jgi:serine O-acetyltransferase